MLDFEQSSIGAFLQIWPEIQINMCLFHLSQSVIRYVQVIRKFFVLFWLTNSAMDL